MRGDKGHAAWLSYVLVLTVGSKSRCCPTAKRVWALPARPVQVEGKHHWRMGICLDPNAGGEGSNGASSVRCAPRALHKSGVREPAAALSAPQRPGCPPTMNADASLSSSRMGHWSAEAAFGSRDADGCVLVRPVGTSSRAHSGSRCELAQGAEVGYCAGCASAAHVA